MTALVRSTFQYNNTLLLLSRYVLELQAAGLNAVGAKICGVVVDGDGATLVHVGGTYGVMIGSAVALRLVSVPHVSTLLLLRNCHEGGKLAASTLSLNIYSKMLETRIYSHNNCNTTQL